MILRTRLQWLLAGSTAVFAFSALVAACVGIDDKKTESVETPATTTVVESTTTSVPTTYIVNSGDSLSSIAASLGVSFNDLVKLNGITNVDKINAGDVLQVPPPTTTTSTTTTVADSTTTTAK